MKGKKKTYAQVAFLLALIVGTVLIVKQQRDMPYQKDEGFIFGTVYHVTYQYDKDLTMKSLLNLIKLTVNFQCSTRNLLLQPSITVKKSKPVICL